MMMNLAPHFADINAAGVTFAATPAENGAPTASSIILVTPDAARSMNTFLGASIEFQPEDINLAAAADASVIYLEGYLFDARLAKLFLHKPRKWRRNIRRVFPSACLTHGVLTGTEADLRDYVSNHVDILFANEDEAISLVETDYPTAVKMLTLLMKW